MIGEVGTTLLLFLFLCLGVALGWQGGMRKLTLWCIVFLVTFASFQLLRMLLIPPDLDKLELIVKLICAGILAVAIGTFTRFSLGHVGPLKARGG